MKFKLNRNCYGVIVKYIIIYNINNPLKLIIK